MTQAEYLQRFETLCTEELELTRRKNADYADEANALLNFRLIEHVTNGRLTMYDGLLVRMTDKFQRFANLLTRPAEVADEAIEDTLRDLSIYAKIALLALQWEKEQEEKEEGVSAPATFVQAADDDELATYSEDADWDNATPPDTEPTPNEDKANSIKQEFLTLIKRLRS